MPATTTVIDARKTSFTADELEAAGYFTQAVAKRKELKVGRGGTKRIVRSYGIVDVDADGKETAKFAKLKAAMAAGDKLPNPFNVGFSYYLIEALKQLGLNKSHTRAKVLETFKALASDKATKNEDGKTFWQVWSKKPARNENGRDMDGRFDLNIEVLQRLGGLNAPGRKLIQLGTKVLGTKGCVLEVTVTQSTQTVRISLNTDSNTPINQTKRTFNKATVAAPVATESTETIAEPAVTATATAEVPTETVAVEPVAAPIAEPVTQVAEEPAVTVDQPAEVAAVEPVTAVTEELQPA